MLFNDECHSKYETAAGCSRRWTFMKMQAIMQLLPDSLFFLIYVLDMQVITAVIGTFLRDNSLSLLCPL